MGNYRRKARSSVGACNGHLSRESHLLETRGKELTGFRRRWCPPVFSEHGAKGMVQVIPACVGVFPSCHFQGASNQCAAAIGLARGESVARVPTERGRHPTMRWAHQRSACHVTNQFWNCVSPRGSR